MPNFIVGNNYSIIDGFYGPKPEYKSAEDQNTFF